MQQVRDEALAGQAAHRTLGDILRIEDNQLRRAIAAVHDQRRDVSEVFRGVLRGVLPGNERRLRSAEQATEGSAFGKSEGATPKARTSTARNA